MCIGKDIVYLNTKSTYEWFSPTRCLYRINNRRIFKVHMNIWRLIIIIYIFASSYFLIFNSILFIYMSYGSFKCFEASLIVQMSKGLKSSSGSRSRDLQQSTVSIWIGTGCLCEKLPQEYIRDCLLGESGSINSDRSYDLRYFARR